MSAPAGSPAPEPASERPELELDDDLDREELRGRYYGLLQELRVLLPGVQVLVAFLLTAPFANRFGELDARGRDLYAVSLLSGIGSVVAFVTPIAFHRLGRRTIRAERLHWAILTSRVGLLGLATSLVAALAVVARLTFSGGVALLFVLGTAAFLLGAWVALPLTAGRRNR